CPKPLPTGAHETMGPDYADFCALTESERTFSVVSGDQIATQKLDLATWQSNTWDAPEKLPGIPDSWDGVSMKSPIPGLAGTGPYVATWDSLLQYEAPEWYRDEIGRASCRERV